MSNFAAYRQTKSKTNDMKRMAIACVAMLVAAGRGGWRQVKHKGYNVGRLPGREHVGGRAAGRRGNLRPDKPDSKQIVRYSFKTGKQTGVIFDADKARGAKVEAVDGYIMSPDGRNVLIQTRTERIYRHSFTAVYYIYNVENNKLTPLSDGGPQQTPLFSPDGQQIAFVRDNDIYLVKLLYNNAESRVTTDGKRNGIINGVPDWVNEEEFSNSRAMVFTADSRQLCWIRYDETSVKQYSMQLFKGSNPTKDEYAEYPGLYTYKYPIAGEDNSKVGVYSYDIKSRQTRRLQVPVEADGYIPRIVMTTDPTKIAVMTLNRHRGRLGRLHGKSAHYGVPKGGGRQGGQVCQLHDRDRH